MTIFKKADTGARARGAPPGAADIEAVGALDPPGKTAVLLEQADSDTATGKTPAAHNKSGVTRM
jgi:hypothetical protein